MAENTGRRERRSCKRYLCVIVILVTRNECAEENLDNICSIESTCNKGETPTQGMIHGSEVCAEGKCVSVGREKSALEEKKVRRGRAK